MMSEAPSDISESRTLRVEWHRNYTAWLWFSGLLSVLIAGLSAYVASGLSENTGREYVALAVAVLASIQAALRPAQRAQSFREAGVELDCAIKRHEIVPAEILDAVRRGQNRIGDTHAEHPPGNPN